MTDSIKCENFIHHSLEVHGEVSGDAECGKYRRQHFLYSRKDAKTGAEAKRSIRWFPIRNNPLLLPITRGRVEIFTSTIRKLIYQTSTFMIIALFITSRDAFALCLEGTRLVALK